MQMEIMQVNSVFRHAKDGPTRGCRRRQTASARTSLPLFAAPDPERSALDYGSFGVSLFCITSTLPSLVPCSFVQYHVLKCRKANGHGN